MVLLALFAFLAVEVVTGRTTGFDQVVLMAFRVAGDPTNPVGPPWLEEMGRDVTALGSFAFLFFVLIAAVAYLVITERRGLALHMAAAVIGGQVISTVLKNAFDRPRPEIPHAARVFTTSFPSGHAMLSAVTFLTLGTILARATPDPSLKRYFLTLAIFLTVMVGLSRIYLGVHYPTDVLAGWCVGAAWAILCSSVSQQLDRGHAKTQL